MDNDKLNKQKLADLLFTLRMRDEKIKKQDNDKEKSYEVRDI